MRRGKLAEVEVDHRVISYADFHAIVSRLGGRIISRDGWWPIARYRLSIPKKNYRELIEEIRRMGEAGT